MAINEKFVWGTIIKDHCIGDYLIREYEEKMHKGVISFHLYINERDTCRSYESLDEALIGAIALKYDGCNTKADIYFMRAIDMFKKY